MTAIHPGIHNLSDAELQGRVDNIASRLRSARHDEGDESWPHHYSRCKRCALIRADYVYRAESRRRAKAGS